MTRALRILSEGEYFLRSSGYKNGSYSLSYKLALCFAIHDHIHNSKSNDFFCFQQKIRDIKTRLNNNECITESCFSFLPLRDDDGSYVYIDHQKGCFPLIIYARSLSAEEKKTFAVKRKSAVLKSLDDLEKKANDIILLLENYKIWNDELQNKIIDLCPDPRHEDDW